jgi:A/G-specific adenine glycosylase
VYEELITRFPRVQDLAEADLSTILELLKPLGLPARAKRLHHLAEVITSEYNGSFPRAEKELHNLPGVGPYGAAAIASQAFDRHAPMIDINTKRIFHRVFSIPFKPRSAPNNALRALVIEHMPRNNARDYNLAMLDLGALVCHAHNPECHDCPVARLCDYRLENSPDWIGEIHG